MNRRCRFPECEPIDSTDFAADWLVNAVPHENGQPVPCSRYQFISGAGDLGDGTCNEHHFNRSNVIQLATSTARIDHVVRAVRAARISGRRVNGWHYRRRHRAEHRMGGQPNTASA